MSPNELLEQANTALLISEQFSEADIKLCFVALGAYWRGAVAIECAYLHTCLSILDGRDTVTCRALGESLCEVLAGAMAGDGREGVQVSIRMREIGRASYTKRVVTRQR